MISLPSLTSEQLSNLNSFHQSSTSGATKKLNISDPKDLEFIKIMLASAGRLPENYPNLYAGLKQGPADKGNRYSDQVRLTDVGKTSKGKATATVWSQIDGKSLLNGAVLMVLDSDTGDLLAHGANTSVKSGFLDCLTRGTTAAQARENLYILYLGHTTDTEGSSRFYSYSAMATAEEETGIQVTVNAPKNLNTGTPEIQIALGRMKDWISPTNCDYIYVEPSENLTDPHLIVPFVGNVALSGSIDLASLTASDMTTAIYISNGDGTNSEVARDSQCTTDQEFVAAFSVGSAPNILQWNFPYDALGYQSTRSIVYNSTSIGDQVDSYFYFGFNSIPLEGGQVAPPFCVQSTGTMTMDIDDNVQSVNCTPIPNLFFWWHCLAKGTLVNMADGTKKPIEDITDKHRVKTGIHDKNLSVEGTVLGRHHSDRITDSHNEIYELQTENGKSLIATASHTIFLTEHICRKIADLTVGDSIVTDEGPSTVKSVEAIIYDGMFYGLGLGDVLEKQEPDFPVNMANFYAGGILCGDQQTIRHNILTTRINLEYTLPRIQAQLRLDYKSAVAEIRN